MSFEHLKRRSSLRANLGTEIILPVIMNDVERFLYDGSMHAFISKMYRLLLNEGPKPGMHESRMKWESDLNVSIDEQFWMELCQNSLSTIINA